MIIMGAMLFLPVIDFWIANETSVQQSLPLEVIVEESSDEESIPLDSTFKVIPYVLEGSVEKFDPVKRAKDLAKNMHRRWCGVYSSFDDEVKSDVTLLFSEIIPKGQIVSLRGEMLIGEVTTPINGYLHAKSNQMELLPLGPQLIPGIETGGSFLGLQGLKLSGWKSTSLQNQGGRQQLLQ